MGITKKKYSGDEQAEKLMQLEAFLAEATFYQSKQEAEHYQG